MQVLELTLPTAAQNIALDEALLEEAEAAGQPRELLRLWEARAPLVVVGRSSRLGDEVHVDACREDGVPILRRTSGGAAIVAGQGCLMYALVLSYARRPELRALDRAHAVVLETIRAGLSDLLPNIQRRGTSDLAVDAHKFSGNSMRCKRTHLLYHGTLLYDFPLQLIARYLREPPRQPDYRARRSHGQFVRNLDVPRDEIAAALAAAWDARDRPSDWPANRVARLVAEKYSSDEWNARL